MSRMGRIVQGFTVGAFFLAFPILAYYTTASLGWIYFIQHVGTNAVLAWVFGRSLCLGREPLCARFAALVHGPLAPEVARYTRQVTAAWTIFFMVMGTVSVLLFWLAPMDFWSVFASFLTPAFVLLMFAIEYAIRLYALPSLQHATILDMARLFWHSSVSQRAR